MVPLPPLPESSIQIPKGILIGSAVFAGLTTVTDRPTDHATRSVTIGHIYVRWCGLIITRHRASTRIGPVLADSSCSRYVARATQPVHRLQIRQTVNSAQLGASPTTPPSYIRIRAVVWAYGRGQTYIQTDTSDHYTFRVVYDSHEM